MSNARASNTNNPTTRIRLLPVNSEFFPVNSEMYDEAWHAQALEAINQASRFIKQQNREVKMQEGKACQRKILESDTPLHNAIRQSKSASEIEKIIKQLGEEAASLMARSVNNDDQIPFDLIEYTTLEEEEKERIEDLLLPLTIKNSLKDFSEEIELKKILIDNECKDNSLLSQTLSAACDITNAVRKIFKESLTHPKKNSYDEEKKEELFETYSKLEHQCHMAEVEHLSGDTANQTLSQVTDPEEINEYLWKALFSNVDVPEPCDIAKIKVKLSPLAWITLLQSYIKLFEEFQIGNCTEFVLSGLHILNNKYKSISGEMCSVKNSDHVVLVLNRAPRSNPLDYKTWGNNAVVCDIWAGEIYPAAKIPSKLSTYRTIQSSKTNAIYNVLGTFNTMLHSLAPEEFTSYNALIWLPSYSQVKQIIPSVEDSQEVKSQKIIKLKHQFIHRFFSIEDKNDVDIVSLPKQNVSADEPNERSSTQKLA